ncbi:hypothetical protein PR048_011253 [Dryococelus australis]|uniref:Uncharacterized protein n=1 Tax=Dryococelus australis TaxID=614101 RepID=A0ABQ9HL44_9NEOP|nr:hypothetical protein PR048_011253 [Dryococelus australis]
MSSMGAIVCILNGNGLRDLFSTVYASVSVDKMFTSHVYVRVVRRNILGYLSLGKLILETTKFNDIVTYYLKCIQLLPFFHESSHFLYAKSCYLYLQDMINLK